MNQWEEARAQRVQAAADELHSGLDDPVAFFARRGMTVSCDEHDGVWWASLGPRATRYGRGTSELDAMKSAVRRWMSEQEHPDLSRKPGEPLP